MNIKLTCHLMPWEMDYALLSFTQLKKSKYHLPEDVNVTFETILNLSSYMINWEESKLPKEYFIEKYNTISLLLEDYNHIKRIYDGDELYGHLDLQRECISKEVDFYGSICPDICFSEYLLSYLIEGAKVIPNKYSIITPQISKVGDADWDEITDPLYVNIPYSDYLNVNVFDVDYNNKNNNQEKSLALINKNKFAGWFDLYSKSFYEELCPFQEEWKGYGPWDFYAILISRWVKEKGIDVQQYILRGETIWMYPSGPFLTNNFSKYYKDLIVLNDIPNQRQNFESNMQLYLDKTMEDLRTKNII
jgi:hypothetical protein